MSATTLMTVETIFCDNEFDCEIRKTYLNRWLVSLRALAEVDVPPSTEVHFFLYLSEDKYHELKVLNEFLASLAPAFNRKFHIVSYQHPEDGYGFDQDSHPDLYKNPNKSAPYRDHLYKKALTKVSLKDHERLIRATLDDDDFWLPWQLEEIVRAAEQAYEPNEIVGVGLRQACVAYIQQKKVDVVELSHHMNGNKFYISSINKLEKQIALSPWSIPENFSEYNIHRMQKIGVTLKSIATNIPGWIYGRWGGNLSLHNKSQYYHALHSRAEFESVADLLHRLSSDLRDDFKRMSKEEQEKADRERHHPEEFVFKLASELLPDNAEAVVVFKFRDKSPDAILKIKPDHLYRTRDFPELQRVNHSTVGFIQARFSDGTRAEITHRGRLSALKYLGQELLDMFLVSPEKLDQDTRENIKLGLDLSTWIIPYDPNETASNKWQFRQI